MRSGAIWYSSRHLSKVRNCFDNEPMEATGNAGLLIHLGSPHGHNTQTTSSSQTWGNVAKFSPFCFWKARRWRGLFSSISEDPYLASQRNDRGTTLRFGRHRRPCIQMQLPSIEAWFVRNLWPCTLDEWRRLCFWPTRLVGYFFTLYFFYFVAFQEFTMLQSPNRHVLGQA